MLAKCANPKCSSRFLYLGEGKLFRIEVPAPGEEGQPSGHPFLVTRKPVRRVEHYWLCARCAASLTLAYDRNAGVIAVPRATAARQPPHAAAS
jgi:hypothetical protein